MNQSIVCKEDRHFFQCSSGASKEWQRAAEFFLHLALRKDRDPGSEPSAFCKPMQESLCLEWAKVCATPRQICSMNILTWSWWSPQAADLPMYWFASRLATNSIASTGWSKMFSVLSCKNWVLFPPYELSTVSMNCTCEILPSGGSRAKQCKTQLRLNLAKAASAAYLAWYHVHP